MRHEGVHHRAPSISRKTAATGIDGGRCLFITDRVSNLRFLVDTGTDLCMFPRKLIPGPKERASYDLFAANSTPILTYGWRTLTLNLGLRQDFTWHFVVADVQLPINGVDLLANFSLLVDCHKNRILDGITSLSAPAQTASTRFLSVKTIGSTTPADDLCTEWPGLTRPSGTPREIHHNTVHHIKTTLGQPVSC
jgi:cleavage and polyadenylation specificity factor subunit 1